jgi:tripartite-type tricarboxylate transporter receptor subunit TctC
VNQAVIVAMSDQKLQSALLKNGMTAADPATPAQFKAYLHDDYARWKAIAKEANIKLD